MNLGGEKKEMWYPADKLTIADWQMVKLDEQFADQMVKKAEKIPAANKMFIKTYALPALSMGQGASFHKVSLPGRFAERTELISTRISVSQYLASSSSSGLEFSTHRS